MTQWSKGDYTGSTNNENDLAILQKAMGWAKDDVANLVSGAKRLGGQGEQVQQSGVIGRNNDIDYFKFDVVSTGTFAVSCDPWTAAQHTAGNNLAVKMSLRDQNDVNIAVSGSTTQVGARISRTLAPGRYYLRVEGKPTNNAPKYGMIGQYDCTGRVPELDAIPDPTPCFCGTDIATASAVTKFFPITMRTNCKAKKHRFQQCLERKQAKGGRLFMTLFLKSGNRWVFKGNSPDVGPNNGDRVCFQRKFGGKQVANKRQWRIRVRSPNNVRYRVRYTKNVRRCEK